MAAVFPKHYLKIRYYKAIQYINEYHTHRERLEAVIKNHFKDVFEIRSYGVLKPKFKFEVTAFKTKEDMFNHEKGLIVYCKRIMKDKFPEELKHGNGNKNILLGLEDFLK